MTVKSASGGQSDRYRDIIVLWIFMALVAAVGFLFLQARIWKGRELALAKLVAYRGKEDPVEYWGEKVRALRLPKEARGGFDEVYCLAGERVSGVFGMRAGEVECSVIWLEISGAGMTVQEFVNINGATLPAGAGSGTLTINVETRRLVDILYEYFGNGPPGELMAPATAEGFARVSAYAAAVRLKEAIEGKDWVNANMKN